jgi:hypothetical protein
LPSNCTVDAFANSSFMEFFQGFVSPFIPNHTVYLFYLLKKISPTVVIDRLPTVSAICQISHFVGRKHTVATTSYTRTPQDSDPTPCAFS